MYWDAALPVEINVPTRGVVSVLLPPTLVGTVAVKTGVPEFANAVTVFHALGVTPEAEVAGGVEAHPLRACGVPLPVSACASEITVCDLPRGIFKEVIASLAARQSQTEIEAPPRR